jgi:hypothetical protein
VIEMPTYWSGNTIVGSSGGTSTSGKPINPSGWVQGEYYAPGNEKYYGQGGGSGGSGGTPSQTPVPAGIASPPSQTPANIAQRAPPQHPQQSQAAQAQYQAMQAQARQVSATPILAARLQGSTGYDPYANIQGITREEYLASRRAPNEVYSPRFGKMISSEEFRQKHPTPLMEVGAQYENIEGQVSRTLGIKEMFGRLQTSFRADQVQYQTLFTEVSKGKTVKPLPGWFTSSHEAYSEFLTGAAEGIEKKPVTSAVNFAAMAALTGGSGYVVSKAPWLAKGITAGRFGSKVNLVNVGGAALGGLYGADVLNRVSRAESPYRTFGEIASTELVPMAAGGYVGSKLKMSGAKGGGRLYEVAFKKGTAYNMPSMPKTIFEMPETIMEKPYVPKSTIIFERTPLEGTIKSSVSSMIEPKYAAALQTGDRLRNTITGSETSFGSPGYRPTGTPKPANAFYTPPKGGETFPGLLVIPGYDIPNTRALYTAEGLQRLPTIEPKASLRPVITESKPATIPEMKLWSEVNAQTTVKTLPLLILPQLKTQPLTKQLTQLKVQPLVKQLTQLRPQTTTKTQVLTQPMVSTQIKVQPLTKQLTQFATRTGTQTKTQVLMQPMVSTQLKVQPLVKQLTQLRPQTTTKTQIMTGTLIQPMKLPKFGDKLTVNFRRSSMAKGYGKFPEIARVASGKRVLGIKGFKFPWEDTKKKKPSGKSKKAAASRKASKSSSRKSSSRKSSSRKSSSRKKR